MARLPRRSGSVAATTAADAKTLAIIEDLETPEKVTEVLRILGTDLSRKQGRRFARDLKLSYYYGGQEVACRETKRGLEVVVSGWGNEVPTTLDRMGVEESKGIAVVFPEPFDAWVREMLPPSPTGRRR